MLEWVLKSFKICRLDVARVDYIGESKMGRGRDGHAPPLSPISFVFMQYLGNNVTPFEAVCLEGIYQIQWADTPHTHTHTHTHNDLLSYQVSTENSNSSYHIKAFIYKTQHNMTSKFLKKWQLFKKSFSLNTCCHGLTPLTLRLAPVPAKLAPVPEHLLPPLVCNTLKRDLITNESLLFKNSIIDI